MDNRKLQTMNNKSASLAMISSQQQHDQIAKEGYYQVVRHLYTTLGISNQLAYQYLCDVVDYFSDLGLVRFEVKKNVSNIERVWDKYRMTSKHKLGALEGKKSENGDVVALWDNLCTEATSRIIDDVTVLEWRVKNHIKRSGQFTDNEERLTMASKILTVRLMIEMSTQHYSAFFEIMGNEYAGGTNFKALFSEFNFEPILEYWRIITSLLLKSPIKVEFSDTCWVRKVYNKIGKRLVDFNLMNECALRALDRDEFYSDKAEEMRKEGYEYKKDTDNK